MVRGRPIRVLVVDDSALVRRSISEALAHDPAIQVAGAAIDPYAARDKILALDPDVMTLDIEMPRMDGLTFLKLIMKHRPMPVIVMSSLTREGSSKALEALQAGAVEVIEKPDGHFSSREHAARLAEKIKAAALARLKTFQAPAPHLIRTPARSASSGENGLRRYSPRQLILLGASTGGTEALKQILTALPEDLPPLCIVQHIPPRFSAAFAQRLNEVCRLRVREACPGDRLQPGSVLIAPGGHHLVLRWAGGGYSAQLSDGPPVHHQRPSVDVLFDSAVKAGAAPHALALLLTGMGADGADGLLNLRQAGATTGAQSEESCVVFGMPKEAIRLGAAQEILHLDQIAARIDDHAGQVALRRIASPALTSS